MADQNLLGELGETVVIVRADGTQLTADLKKEKTKVTKIADEIGGAFSSSFTKLVGAFTLGGLIEKGITGLVRFGEAAVESAGRLADLSDKTGASIEFLQRAGFVAKQSGSNVEELTQAVFKLGVNIAGATAEDKVGTGLAKLGLNLAEIKRLKPEQQFEIIAQKLAAMENPQERNRLAVELFGRTVGNILPIITSEYARLAREAPVASDAQIRALDAAGDAWERMKGRISSSVTQALGSIALLTERVGERGLLGTLKQLGGLAIANPGKTLLYGPSGLIAGYATQIELEKTLDKAMKDRAKTTTEEAAPAQKSYSQELKDSKDRLKDLTAEQKTELKAAIELGKGTEELKVKFDLTEASLGMFKDQMKQTESQTLKNISKTAEYGKAVDALVSRFGVDAVVKGKQYADALVRIGGVTKLTKEETIEFNKVLDEALQKMRLLGLSGSADFEKIHKAWIQTQTAIINDLVKPGALPDLPSALTGDDIKRAGAAATWNRWVQDQVKSFNSIITTNPVSFLNLLGGTTTLGKAPSLMQTLGKTMLSAFTGPGGFTEQLGPTVLQALTGGGNVGKSVGGLAGQALGSSLSKSLGGTLTKKLGSTIGGALGSILPGLGTILGSFAGMGVEKLVGAISGINKNVTKGGREDFAKQLGFGNLGGLYDDLRKLGAEGEKLANIGLNVIGRKDEAGNKKWMEDVLKFYDSVDAKAKKQIEDEMDARGKLQAAVERYGFTIEELGPKWKQQALDEQAKQLIEDYTVLTASGIEVETVTGRMAEKINEYIHLAMKTGTEVPEAMKPMLQKMIDMGLLTDINGNKIEDLEDSGLSFSQTLTQGFKTVVDKLTELIEKITGGLTPALNNLPSPTVKVGVEVDDRTGGFFGRLRPQGEGDGGGLQMQEGGFGNFGAGTRAVLHGPEAVMPIDQLQSMLLSATQTLTAEDLVQAMMAAGLNRPDITIAPHIEGALANEMYAFARMFIPAVTQVLRDSGELRGGLASTLAVGEG